MTEYHIIELTCYEASFLDKLLSDYGYPFPYRDILDRKRISKKLKASCPHYHNNHKQWDVVREK